MRKRSLCAFVIALSLIAAAGTSSRAQDADKQIASMMAEINQLSNEQKQMPAKVEQSLAQKRQHEQQFKALDGESANLKSESNAIETQRPGVRSACSGTYPKSQIEAARARCRAAQAPFNRRVDAYNAKNNRLKGRYQAVRTRESARVAAAKLLYDRNQAITKRIAALRDRVKALQMAAKPKTCTEKCRGMASNDAAAQCLQSCFDGARGAGGLPTVEQKQRPVFSATPNDKRTPQQAIDEYKKSGAANPMPESYRRKGTVPPSPTQNR
jgi:DNA repair exonuclease SbcCD ATPase subunit